jgi:hypothetical protein
VLRGERGGRVRRLSRWEGEYYDRELRQQRRVFIVIPIRIEAR